MEPIHSARLLLYVFQAACFWCLYFTGSESADASTQTKVILTYEVESQVLVSADACSQTDSAHTAELQMADCDLESLAVFLKKVEGQVCAQLERNVQSRAFDDYQVEWEEPVAMVSCIHRLSDRAMMEQKLPVTDLSWNCHGTALAAAFGHMDHQDWCSHRGYVCVWYLQQRGLDPCRAADSIEAPSCVMAVSFHPVEPAHLVAGTFSGEICVWNTASESDQLVAMSGLHQHGHHEPVSQVLWMEDQESRKLTHNLLSLGMEGKVLLWQLNKREKSLHILRGFHIMSVAAAPPLSPLRGVGGRMGKSTAVGATCLCMSPEDKSLFVVGGENGGIFKCTLHSRLPDATPLNALDGGNLSNPVTFAFRAHHGPVYAVDISPFQRNVFLTCSTDSTARIYSLLETNPLLTVEVSATYLYCAAWSLTRPLVFALGTQDGRVLIYDLMESYINPVHVLEVENERLGAVEALQFNRSRPEVLAVSHVTGHVTVWRLSSQLVNQQLNEMRALEDLVSQTLSI